MIFVRGKEKGKYNRFISQGCVNFQLSSPFSRGAAISTWPTIPHKPEPEPGQREWSCVVGSAPWSSERFVGVSFPVSDAICREAVLHSRRQ